MRMLYDCRSYDTGKAESLAQKLASDPQQGLLLTAWQAAHLVNSTSASYATSCVVVPDFLNYARLLNTGQAAAMLRLAGPLPKAFSAGLAGLPALMANPLRTASMDFWVIAQVLLRYDLALLPGSFSGRVVLHSYLADFAFAFDRRDFVTGFFNQARRFSPGVQTQQLPLALTCLARWGLSPSLCAFLYSPQAAQLIAPLQASRASTLYASCEFLADVSSLPRDLQQTAVLSQAGGDLLNGLIVTAAGDI